MSRRSGQARRRRLRVKAERDVIRVSFLDLLTNFGPLTAAFPQWRREKTDGR